MMHSMYDNEVVIFTFLKCPPISLSLSLYIYIYIYYLVVTIRTVSSTFSNSTFCPHSVFMCFVWI